jgi:mono/diheme cytochrome c family protein
MRLAVLALVAVISVVAGWQATSFAQATPGVRSAPVYTTAQAALGQAAYRASCASCHGDSLDDGAFGPPLKGVAFIQLV